MENLIEKNIARFAFLNLMIQNQIQKSTTKSRKADLAMRKNAIKTIVKSTFIDLGVNIIGFKMHRQIDLSFFSDRK